MHFSGIFGNTLISGSYWVTHFTVLRFYKHFRHFLLVAEKVALKCISGRGLQAVLQKFETFLGTALFILPAISSSTIQILIIVGSMLLTRRR